MSEVQVVRFASGDGVCEGDLHPPEGPDPAPAVVMAHGLAAERSFGLAPFIERFVGAGLAVLAFDYRHFGGSTGTPRLLVSPHRQLADYRAAMRFLRETPAIDSDRLALWGTSFSGGHVLRVASERPSGLRAVVSQIPFVSGIASTLAFPLRYHLPAIAWGVLDSLGGLFGADPVRVPVTREGQGLALLASPESHAGYRALVDPRADWSGRVPARVFLRILAYHPGLRASRIRAPTLLVAARDDRICPIRSTRRTAARIPGGRVEELPIGHFDPYEGEWFERAVQVETEFLTRHLHPDRT